MSGCITCSHAHARAHKALQPANLCCTRLIHPAPALGCSGVSASGACAEGLARAQGALHAMLVPVPRWGKAKRVSQAHATHSHPYAPSHNPGPHTCTAMPCQTPSSCLPSVQQENQSHCHAWAPRGMPRCLQCMHGVPCAPSIQQQPCTSTNTCSRTACGYRALTPWCPLVSHDMTAMCVHSHMAFSAAPV